MTHQLNNSPFELARDHSPDLGKLKHHHRDNNINKNDDKQIKLCANQPDVLDELGPYDILCGRGRQSWNNIGNRRFRVIVNLNLKRYLDAPRRKDKSSVIQSIITMIQQEMGGRFLKEKGNKLIELGKRETHEKVGHALRDLQNAQMNDASSYQGSEASVSSSSAIAITCRQEDMNTCKPDLLQSTSSQGGSNNNDNRKLENVDTMCFDISVMPREDGVSSSHLVDDNSTMDMDAPFVDPFR